MDNVALISTLIGQLAVIIRGEPALGEQGSAAIEVLALLGTLIMRGEEARAQLEELAARVQAMVATDREPSTSEWQEFRTLARQQHEILNPPNFPQTAD